MGSAIRFRATVDLPRLSAGFGDFVQRVGGSALLTPILILMRVNPLIAVGTGLLYSVPTKALAAWMHARQKSVDWATVIALCLGAFRTTAMSSSLLR